MSPTRFAKLLDGWLHYAWVVLAVMFLVMLATAGVRAAPSVLIVPLEHAFGWSSTTVSAAISINIFLFGLIGPFAAALMQTIGIRRTVLIALTVLTVTVGLSGFINQPWQLFATWGVLVGVGSGATAGGLAATVATRWFAQRRGLAVGLLMASNASGQLVFLPVLAAIAESGSWRVVSWVLAAVMAALIPTVLILVPDSPAQVRAAPYGALADTPRAAGVNPFSFAIHGLLRGLRSADFWLLFASFWVCGFSTNGLIGTHLIAYCVDHGLPEVSGAGLLAAMGIFDLVGTTASGWLTDRYNPRILLFWYYGLRGLSLVALPFTDFGPVSLGLFAVFYGLDWIATVPPTVTLTTSIFGKHEAPVIVAWIMAGHQVGAATAALGAGAIRTETGGYAMAFVASGVACAIASVLVLRINRQPAAIAAAG